VQYDLEATCYYIPQIKQTLRARYDFLYMKLAELTNVLIAKFKHNKELVPLEWNVHLGCKVAEIHHHSHTWCFCDYNTAIKQINESQEPTYLGTMGQCWKAWQNNSLQFNEVVIEGTAPMNGTTRRAKLIIEGLDIEE